MKILNILLNLFRFDRTNWKAVVLCILASMVFWIFNSLNKKYAANVRFPLLFEFDGDKYAVAAPLPKYIVLNVTGSGWDLFRKRFDWKKPPVIIPLERPNEIQKIVGSTTAPRLASQVGGLQINFVVTDTLRFKIDKKDFHRYKLTPDLTDLSFREGYGRTSPIVVLPDSVRLEGPESILHTLRDSIVLRVSQHEVAEDYRDEVEIIFPGSEMVKKTPPIAQIMFEVAEVKTIEVKLKVETGSPMNLLHDSVKAVFQIPSIHFPEFNEQLKNISVHVNKNQFRHTQRALPRLLNAPPYAQLRRIDSVALRTN